MLEQIRDDLRAILASSRQDCPLEPGFASDLLGQYVRIVDANCLGSPVLRRFEDEANRYDSITAC